jgi:hypothetical protein
MVAAGAGFIGVGAALFFVFWLALAIPTSVIAYRAGYPRWIAYVAWCPGVMLYPCTAIYSWFPDLPGRGAAMAFSTWFFWVPGALVLWVVSFNKSRTAEVHKTDNA